MQTIVDYHFATTLGHTVNNADAAVVIIYIFFIRTRNELVTAVADEHRMPHQVIDSAIGLLGVHRHLVCRHRVEGGELHLGFTVPLALDAI